MQMVVCLMLQHSVLEKLELHSKEKIADAYQFMLLEQASRLQYCAPLGSVLQFIEGTEVP